MHSAAGDRFPGHAEDDAGRFVLRDRGGAGGVHFVEAGGAVVAHAGEDHADGVRAGGLRDRAEEDVDARLVAGDERAVVEVDAVLGAVAHDQHVPVAGRDQRAAVDDAVAFRGFLDRHAAGLIQPLRERGGEDLGHVLHDDHAGRIGRHRLEDFAQRLGAAGRRADGDDLARRRASTSDARAAG